MANPARPGTRFGGMVIEETATGQLLGRCSGTVVDSPNRSVVWTAGHCIFRPAKYATPYPVILFVPDAEPGAGPFAPTAPYGVWTAAAYAIARDWGRHGSVRRFKQDFGALLMSRNAQGETIQQALGGGQRISFKGATRGRVEVRGFPAEGRFTNNDSEIGCGPRAIGRYSRRLAGPGPRPMAIRCAMTEGASGGPWLEHVGRGGVGTVISNTSAASVKPGFLFGPVLTGVAHRVWAAMAHRAVP